jgi:hypothetical protein
MLADRVSLPPSRNCVLAQRRRNALDSPALIGHPACGLEYSDFDTPKTKVCFQGLGFKYQLNRRWSAIQKSGNQDRYPSSMHRHKNRGGSG